MTEERERAEANELREYLRLPEGGISTRALLALAFQDRGASTYDLEYAEALLRSNGWLPPEERAAAPPTHESEVKDSEEKVSTQETRSPSDTTLDLEAIRERLAAASAVTRGERWMMQLSDEPDDAFQPFEIAAVDGEGADEQLALVCGKLEYAEPVAAFIAHARKDIPLLLAEVVRLRSLSPEPRGEQGPLGGGWASIESVPHDGTLVLLLNANQGNVMAVAGYRRVHARFEAIGGNVFYQPTHWHALPPPPSTPRETVEK